MLKGGTKSAEAVLLQDLEVFAIVRGGTNSWGGEEGGKRDMFYPAFFWGGRKIYNFPIW